MPGAARVLAVDDDPHVLEMVSEFLTLQGYEVVTAQNAGDAFMLLEAAPPDVVLLDVVMPGVDGMTALRRIRQVHPELPVIMLTGSIDIELARNTLKRSAFDYVAKPFDMDHLVRVVEAAVAHRG